MDKLITIINFILIIFIVLANIKYFKKELKIKKSTTNIEGESKEVIVDKIKKELNTHGLGIMYLSSIFILVLLNFKNNLNTRILSQALYITGGVQSVFFLIKKDFTKVSLALRIFCVVIISCIIELLK